MKHNLGSAGVGVGLLPGISACLIVRNEASYLPECLASLAGAVDEVCVVDTGSTDQTKQLALAAGARVTDFAWTNDFSAARNASLAMARHEWVLAIDADERLTPDSKQELRGTVRNASHLGFLVERLDLRPEGAPDVIALPRLFRNHPSIRFRRPVHEDVMDTLRELGELSPPACQVRLLHVGYLPEALRSVDKLARNLAILRARFQAAPEDLYNSYKLGTSLAPGEERRLALASAVHSLAALSQAELCELAFLPRLLQATASDAWAEAHLSRALELCEQGLTIVPDALLLLQLKAELCCAAGNFALADSIGETLKGWSNFNAVRGESAHDLMLSLARLQVRLALESRGTLGILESDALQEVNVFCGALRVQLRGGALEFVSQTLNELVETRFADDAVKLVCGELAWARGDLTTAKAVLAATDAHNESGAEAHGLLALLRDASGELFSLPSPRCASQAGLVACLGAASASVPLNLETAGLDAGFNLAVVKQWCSVWEEERANLQSLRAGSLNKA